MDGLVAFLRARYDERERAARYVLSDYAEHKASWTVQCTGVLQLGDDMVPTGDGPLAEFIADNDPAFVLADIAAKRKLLQLHERVLLEHTHPLVTDAHLTKERLAVCASCEPPRQFRRTLSWPCPTLKVLALPFAGHPDYDESWRP